MTFHNLSTKYDQCHFGFMRSILLLSFKFVQIFGLKVTAYFLSQHYAAL